MVRFCALALACLLAACAKPRVCTHGPNQNPYVSVLPAAAETTGDALPRFGDDFQFGTATAAYQIESGNHASDWFLWEQLGKITHDDHADDGPQGEAHYPDDIARMKALGLNAYRLSLEWGRLFATREAFDARAPDPDAVTYYRDLLTTLRRNGIRPMVTLFHFSLPVWLQAPPAETPRGVREASFAADLAAYAAFAGDTFGDVVDEWITINEPMGLLAGAYGDGTFPPGHVLDADAFLEAFANLAEAHARAYDALRAHDRRDADGDGAPARVSFSTHQRLWLPADAHDARDLKAARRVRYINNLAMLDAAVCGNLDAELDERWEGARDRAGDAALKGRLDFIALNFYGVGMVTHAEIPVLLGVPRTSGLPTAAPKSDVGWDLAPQALAPVLAELADYGLPIVITENGVADGADTRRAKLIAETLAEALRARGRGVDLRGYYHWSLFDNFEWQSGFCPRYGLFAVDDAEPDRPRVARPSAEVYARIIKEKTVSPALRRDLSYGPATPCH